MLSFLTYSILILLLPFLFLGFILPLGIFLGAPIYAPSCVAATYMACKLQKTLRKRQTIYKIKTKLLFTKRKRREFIFLNGKELYFRANQIIRQRSIIKLTHALQGGQDSP